MRLLITAILFLICTGARAQFKGLIVNEFSQGDQGSREYIELLVVGKRTCSDSTADIRGWIVDDQNGWYGTTNASNGHYRFRNIPLWSAVPFGSIILLYNSASGQKNLSILLPDDPTDANNDGAYILPINSSTYLEEHDTDPNSLTLSPAYIYPPATATAGYNGTSNTWINHVALNNTGGDVLSVVSRNKRDSAFFSIGYGFITNAGFHLPTVSINNVGAGQSAGLIDSNYQLSSRWSIAPVPAFETPGRPNGGINTTWINAMRTTPVALHTYTTACSNGPYVFFGQTIIASGAYTVLYNNNTACVDTNDLYVVIKRTDVKDTTACDSLIYKGIKYTANTTIVDHISSVVINCDSIVRTLNIKINKSSSSFTAVCMLSGQTYVFNGQPVATSGSYSATLTNARGCDSVARLQIVFKELRTDTVRGCNAVVFNGTSYTSAATLYDTVKSRALPNCDSLIVKTVIQVNPSKINFITACANDGSVYNFNGQLLTTTGTYSSLLSTTAGCDSIVRVYIVFKKVVRQNFTGCDSVIVQNRTYYQSAAFTDTIKSVVTGCDSLLTVNTIVVNQSRVSYQTACAAGSYLFFGQMLTTGGNFSHTLTTSSGCDSIIKLYLVIVRRQTQTLSGCDSLRFSNQTFYATTTLYDTVPSAVTACDSLIYSTIINISPTKHNYITVCLAPGQSYIFNSQTITASGSYTSTFSSGGCDSIVHLYLVAAKQVSNSVRGCDSLMYNGITYTASTVLLTVIPSAVTTCDSILQQTIIGIAATSHYYKTACVPAGGSYIFNGQTLTTSGQYTAQYATAACDSVVHLTLTIARLQLQTISGCDSVLYNGSWYFTNLQISDTVRSLLTGCDSFYFIKNLVVSRKTEVQTTVCLQQGQGYNFNGQVLTATGNYTATFSRPGLCDSTVHLYALFSRTAILNLAGCDSVSYNGKVYFSSTVIADTIKSLVTHCDSIIITTTITVRVKPVLQHSNDTTICKGDGVVLFASAAGAVSSWVGLGAQTTISVAPAFTTTYTAVAIDATGCRATANVTVTVHDFLVTVNASLNPVLAGNNVLLTTTANLPYSIYQWAPTAFFSNQSGKSQRLVADSSLTVMVIGASDAGCRDTAVLLLEVAPLDDIYIPSGFTPNGDSRNDEVRVLGSSIATIDFKIFSRWGQLIFRTTDKLKGWDGTVNGRPQASGSYVYVVRALKTNGKVVEKKGTVVLIR